jgi:hypothetical protein
MALRRSRLDLRPAGLARKEGVEKPGRLVVRKPVRRDVLHLIRPQRLPLC